MHEPLDDIALAARLIANDLDVTATARVAREYAAFRLPTSGGGVLPSLEWITSGVALLPCEDRLGRPVIVIRPRYHRPGNIEMFRAGLRTTLDAVKAHFLNKRTAEFSNNNPLEQYAMVWDFGGASWSNADWEAFHTTLHEGTHHYPNMGSQIYVLNVSKPFRWFWSTACRFLHPKIRRKCCLVAPGNVRACMEQVLDPASLPPEYGGTGRPWMGPSEARFFEDQVGELAAAVYLRAGVVPQGAKPPRSDGGMGRSDECDKEEVWAKVLAPRKRSDASDCWCGCAG
mmetsp:Transcript_57753/g.159893  ORF Transcript_57753/g.159893 Transcript_57753/m.159893 type:complete len:286 (+) Transcript_57753:228-1085(+)